MSVSWFKFTASAVVAGALCVGATASSAQAGSMVLGDSGWKASWSSAFDDANNTHVTLTVLAETCDAVVLQKVAVFTDGPDQYGMIVPIEINFEQIRGDAVQQIVFTSENVTNASGTDWSGFKFIIEDGTKGTPADTHYNLDETFGGSDPFDTSPFSVTEIGSPYGMPQIITVGDGTLHNGEVWYPGMASGAGQLVINAAPSCEGVKRFVFKEQPIPSAIPLPAAAWTGLTGLIGLALPRAARKFRKSIA